MTFITQIYQNLQNVNRDNMNLFYDDKDQKLTGYFNQVPCIANGVGNLSNNFGQIGTTNQFAFTDGVIRFANQPTPLNSSIETAFANLIGSTVTVTASSSPPAQLYVVAVLTMTQLDAFKVENTVVISTTAMTLADIAGETNPLAYVPLFAITNTTGVYTIAVDNNCAFNYYPVASAGIVDSGLVGVVGNTWIKFATAISSNATAGKYPLIIQCGHTGVTTNVNGFGQLVFDTPFKTIHYSVVPVVQNSYNGGTNKFSLIPAIITFWIFFTSIRKPPPTKALING